MANLTGDVDAFIAHYASEYYDPAKAREYYLQNRNLKGRRSSSELKTEKKKIGWTYAKTQIDKEKDAVLDQTAEAQKQAVKALRTNAMVKRKAIAKNLKILMKKIEEKSKAERQKISDDRAAQIEKIAAEVESKIAGLPNIPKGLDKAATARMRADRAAAIARIRGEAKTARETVATDAKMKGDSLSKATSGLRKSSQGSARLNRDTVAKDIKGSLQQARKNYTVLKESVKAKYEATYQAQYDAIKKNA